MAFGGLLGNLQGQFMGGLMPGATDPMSLARQQFQNRMAGTTRMQNPLGNFMGGVPNYTNIFGMYGHNQPQSIWSANKPYAQQPTPNQFFNQQPTGQAGQTPAGPQTTQDKINAYFQSIYPSSRYGGGYAQDVSNQLSPTINWLASILRNR